MRDRQRQREREKERERERKNNCARDTQTIAPKEINQKYIYYASMAH